MLDFIINISRCLISSTSDSNDENQEPPQKRRSGLIANQDPDDIRYDEKNHWQLQIDGTAKDVNTLDALTEADSFDLLEMRNCPLSCWQ